MSTSLRNRPLLGPTDADLFVEPSAWPRLTTAIRNGLNVLLVGSPGTGKTSALRMLDRLNLGRPSVYVDLARASTADEALILVADGLGVAQPSALSEQFIKLGQAANPAPDADLLQLVALLRKAPSTLLLVDEPPAGDEGHRLFGRLRDELWQLDHQWVVAGSRTIASALDRPPANAFFEVRAELSALDSDQQRELLERRIPGADWHILDALVDKVDHPRELIALAREVVLSGDDPERVVGRILDAKQRLAELSPLQSAVVEYIRRNGGTFASDPALAESLSVSQTQLSQTLKELSSKRIVFGHQDRRGQGRPRTVFELAPEFQA